MPRRRATVQPASTETKTPTTRAAKEKDETPIPIVSSETENTDAVAVVEEIVEATVAVEAPVEAPRAVSTDVGMVQTKEAPKPPMREEGVPNGIILGPGEPIRIEGDDNGQTVIVSCDIYRKTYPAGARRPSYILLYAKGSEVLKSQLVPVQQQ